MKRTKKDIFVIILCIVFGLLQIVGMYNYMRTNNTPRSSSNTSMPTESTVESEEDEEDSVADVFMDAQENVVESIRNGTVYFKIYASVRRINSKVSHIEVTGMTYLAMHPLDNGWEFKYKVNYRECDSSWNTIDIDNCNVIVNVDSNGKIIDSEIER